MENAHSPEAYSDSDDDGYEHSVGSFSKPASITTGLCGVEAFREVPALYKTQLGLCAKSH